MTWYSGRIPCLILPSLLHISSLLAVLLRALQGTKDKQVPLPVRARTRSGYMMTSPTFAKWRPRRETRGKVTSWLFAAPRSVLSPYYFESCDFRQWEIRGVKKKCRPMNVCAFLGGKTTEHESFPAQINVRQGAKHRKKEGECHFLDCWKKFFWKLHKICLLIVVCLV